MNYADEFLRYRATHDLTQTEFGRLIGLGIVSVSKIENGKCIPRKITQIKFNILKEKEGQDGNR